MAEEIICLTTVLHVTFFSFVKRIGGNFHSSERHSGPGSTVLKSMTPRNLATLRPLQENLQGQNSFSEY